MFFGVNSPNVTAITRARRSLGTSNRLDVPSEHRAGVKAVTPKHRLVFVSDEQPVLYQSAVTRKSPETVHNIELVNL